MKNNKIGNGRVLCITEQYCLIYKNGYLNLFDNNVLSDRKSIGDWKNKLTLLSRLMRLEPRCATMISEHECLLSYNGAVYLYDFEYKTFKQEHQFDRGMKNPLSFCKVLDCNGMVKIYYGEYIWNKNKGPVAIYRRDNDGWEKVFEFSEVLVTHIHNIVYDEYRNRFYILTGDSDEESGIWIADIEFKNVKLLIGGKQEFRSCVAFPAEDGLIFATDTPLETNYLSLIRIKNDKVKKVERLCSLPGSCIYGEVVGSKCYISTTVEPDSSLPTWWYRLTYRLGKGIKDRYSHVYEIDNNCRVNEIYKQRKDFMPLWLFQFGNILFPYNETKKLYIVTQSLKGGHGKTIELK